jgi:hypothetical protein
MKKHMFVLGAALAACLGSTVAVAQEANEVDIATLTCKQLQGMDANAVGFAIVWIDGYLGGRADDSVFNLDRMTANAEEVDRQCAKSPTRSVLDIVRKFEESQTEE